MSKYDMTLQANRFVAIATDERVLCWRRTFLVLDAHAFRAGGDEHFSAGDEHVKNVRSILVTLTQPVTSDFQTELTRISSSPPKTCAFTLGRSESYVDA